MHRKMQAPRDQAQENTTSTLRRVFTNAPVVQRLCTRPRPNSTRDAGGLHFMKGSLVPLLRILITQVE
jgi:hypothetical protein